MSVPPYVPHSVVSTFDYSCNADPEFYGVCMKLEEAQQECQGVAAGPLQWTVPDIGIWEAVDPETGAVYEISEVEY